MRQVTVEHHHQGVAGNCENSQQQSDRHDRINLAKFNCAGQQKTQSSLRSETVRRSARVHTERYLSAAFDRSAFETAQRLRVHPGKTHTQNG
jgi:hypothetical protein